MDEFGERGQDAREWKKKDGGILPTLRGIMRDEAGGDPMTQLKWSRKSTRKLAKELKRRGHSISRGTVGRMLMELGFSLKANVKNLSGRRHPDRERQFQQIRKRVQERRRKGLPVISVDTKKKEIVANFHSAGKIWRRKPIKVSDHDFPSPDLGRAIPFGIYDLQLNHGLVAVGTSAQTASFGVDAVDRWHGQIGSRMYPKAKDLLILCDNGGCNGSKNRLWKCELQRFADRSGIAVHVAHYPPGASKWNPIEHRMFSFISKNWAGQPLTSYEKILKFIRTTRTETGLHVRACLLRKCYPTGVKVSDEQMGSLQLRCGRVLPKWNYSIHPRLN